MQTPKIQLAPSKSAFTYTICASDWAFKYILEGSILQGMRHESLNFHKVAQWAESLCHMQNGNAKKNGDVEMALVNQKGKYLTAKVYAKVVILNILKQEPL